MSRFSFWHGGGHPTIEYLGSLVQTNASGNFNSKTFSGVNFGEPSDDREIFLGICIRNSAFSQRTISPLLIGGVSAIIGAMPTTAGNINASVAVAHAAVPFGAAGSVELAFSGNISALAICVYRVTGRAVVGAGHVDYATLPSNVGGTSVADIIGVDIPSNGFAISALAPEGGTTGMVVGGAGITLDGTMNTTSSGTLNNYVGHSSIQDAGISGGTISWDWTTNSRYATAAWAFQ